MRRLEGKTALVTGASSGLGRAVALACAAEGANVVLLARSESKLQEVAALAQQQAIRTLVCPADVAVEQAIESAILKAQQSFGFIEVLVNNAGTNIAPRSIADTSTADWQKLLTINLTSAYVTTRALLPEMKARGKGTIVNIASWAASHPSLLAGVAYSTAKRGMEALTRITNEEANPFGVRACVINPAEINTPILDLRPSPPSPQQRQMMMQAEDVAEVVVLVAALPQRVTIETIELKPTQKAS